MADIQKLEAKYTKLDCILHRNEEDLNKLSVNIEKYEQQTTTLSKETIPPLKAWFYIRMFSRRGNSILCRLHLEKKY